MKACRNLGSSLVINGAGFNRYREQWRLIVEDKL